MNCDNFIKILNTESEFNKAQMEGLDTILEKYPYFQTARALQLKGYYQNQSFFYEPALKKTAVYTADRSVLFEYIVMEEFNQIEVSNQIKNRQSKNDQNDETDLGKILQLNKEEADSVLDPNLFEKQNPQDIESGLVETAQEEVEEVPSSKNEEQEKPSETSPQEEIDKDQSRSFTEWLKLSASEEENPKEKTSKLEENNKDKGQKKSREQEMIDKFIKNNPKIKPSSEKNNDPISLQNSDSETTLMTETLAKIYADQKKYDKAIQAYKILILKNPEKSGLFADRIQQIENNKENKN